MNGPVIISFGCPRSGTTFLHDCLKVLEPPASLVLKLTEGNGLHPAQSRTGLWELARLFRGRRLIFVRTVRDPRGIAESFLASRTEALRASMPGISRNSDGDIVRWIREESTSSMIQRPQLQEEEHCLFCDVLYEGLGEEGYRNNIVAWIGDNGIDDESSLERFREKLAGFGKKPVRKGRLSEKMGLVSTPEEREFFKTRLRTIIQREGYGP